MDDAEFWNVIETAAGNSAGDLEQAEEALLRELTARQPTGIEQFQQILQSRLDAAYTWDLWGAAYIINGGCSNDGFEYFRCWLVSRGRSIYDSAIATPDSLANIVSADGDEEDREFESLLYVGGRAYEKVTRSKMPHHSRVPLVHEVSGKLPLVQLEFETRVPWVLAEPEAEG